MNIFFSWFKAGFGLSVVFAFLSFSGCKPGQEGTKERKKPVIVATTGMIADAVKMIAGDSVEVIALMGPGVDPHLYKATQGDLARLTEADYVFYNGLHLEGKMGEILEKLGKKKPVVPISAGLDHNGLRKSADFADAVDPHIWFDVALWSSGVQMVGDTLAALMPANASFFAENTRIYRDSLAALHNWTTNQIATIPEGGRVLITAHDAFGYFGLAYKIEVRGLQGISTVSEFGLKDVTSLVDFIINRKVKAVFVETSVSSKAIDAVMEGCKQKGHPVAKGGSLYSDAMGDEGTPAGTYTGMVRANVNTIVNALR